MYSVGDCQRRAKRSAQRQLVAFEVWATCSRCVTFKKWLRQMQRISPLLTSTQERTHIKTLENKHAASHMSWSARQRSHKTVASATCLGIRPCELGSLTSMLQQAQQSPSYSPPTRTSLTSK